MEKNREEAKYPLFFVEKNENNRQNGPKCIIILGKEGRGEISESSNIRNSKDSRNYFFI